MAGYSSPEILNTCNGTMQEPLLFILHIMVSKKKLALYIVFDLRNDTAIN